METPYPGGRSFIKQAFARRRMPKETWGVATSSLTDSSLRQYETELIRWWSLYQVRHIDSLAAGIPEVLSFLANELKKGPS